MAVKRAATAAIDGFESHVVPIIADLDAGFGSEHATYLLAKEMIKAGGHANTMNQFAAARGRPRGCHSRQAPDVDP